ncbi:MAG: hypothetical protein E6X43_15895, partial [Peptostreptococcaceae bacterium]|nr:hypothetical protein [Peptostreptococcaceae bacterium]
VSDGDLDKLEIKSNIQVAKLISKEIDSNEDEVNRKKLINYLLDYISYISNGDLVEDKKEKLIKYLTDVENKYKNFISKLKEVINNDEVKITGYLSNKHNFHNKIAFKTDNKVIKALMTGSSNLTKNTLYIKGHKLYNIIKFAIVISTNKKFLN